VRTLCWREHCVRFSSASLRYYCSRYPAAYRNGGSHACLACAHFPAPRYAAGHAWHIPRLDMLLFGSSWPCVRRYLPRVYYGSCLYFPGRTRMFAPARRGQAGSVVFITRNGGHCCLRSAARLLGYTTTVLFGGLDFVLGSDRKHSWFLLYVWTAYARIDATMVAFRRCRYHNSTSFWTAGRNISGCPSTFASVPAVPRTFPPCLRCLTF